MTFNKCAIAVAMATLGSVATAQAAQLPTIQLADGTQLPTINIYGRAHVTVQGADDRETDGRESQVRSTTSRIGVRGDYKIPDAGHDLKIVYQFEWGVDIADQENGADDNITSRNQYLGLAGDFGEVRVGRHDTVLKSSQGGVDLFNDLEGDLKTIFKGDNRLGNTVTYLTPTLDGFSAGFTLVSEDNSKQIDDDGDSVTGISSALKYGDAKLKKMPYYAAIAYDSKVAGYDTLRVTGQTKLGDFKLGVMYQNQEQVEWDSDNDLRVDRGDHDGYLVSVAYDLNEKYTVKAQYQKGERDNDVKPAMYSIGLDYKLAKPALLYVFYSYSDLDTSVTNEENGHSMDDENWFGGGLLFKF